MAVGMENGGAKSRSAAADAAPGLDDLKEDVSEMADAAVRRGRHFVDSARAQAIDYVDRRKNDAAQSVADVANSLREATKPFDDRPNIRAFADTAADGLDQLAESIRERSFEDIYGEVEEVIRRRPLAVGAAAMLVGFMAARFLKSSAEYDDFDDESVRPNPRTRMASTGNTAGSPRSGMGGSGRAGGSARSTAGSTGGMGGGSGGGGAGGAEQI
jgi:uncharacterized membrane protein YgcG